MSKGRLTRQELSWLLTQEAQHAAERLRAGVQVLRTGAPPPSVPDPVEHLHVDASLDALDDVMKMLSNLNQRQASGHPAHATRRGRIDLAALVVDIAPAARLSFEPGGGTEVYGDEADFRRMIQVLIGSGTGEGASVTIRREDDEVRISTTLGPEISPTASTERAWLSRMAVRYGGRHDLDGGAESIVLRADGAAERSERESLRRELDEARKQGEVYARELAAMMERGEEVTTISSVPPPLAIPGGDRFETLTKLCAGVSTELRAALGPLVRELGAIRRHEVTDEQLATLRRRASFAQDLLGTLHVIGGVPSHELATEIDLHEVARVAAREGSSAGERTGARVVVRPGTSAERIYVRAGGKAIAALARELVTHAVAASAGGGIVELSVTGDAGGPRLVVDDAGSPLPASARRPFLALEAHAGQYGRPSALPIFVAAELAACVGARLELGDAPSREAEADDDDAGGRATIGGGLRVVVTFANR
ncbi:MAG: Sensor protein basS/pmrB [Labilithrix sp.]|nr:Sensor protein basS/pmrB [Labilithrix sp.]